MWNKTIWDITTIVKITWVCLCCARVYAHSCMQACVCSSWFTLNNLKDSKAFLALSTLIIRINSEHSKMMTLILVIHCGKSTNFTDLFARNQILVAQYTNCLTLNMWYNPFILQIPYLFIKWQRNIMYYIEKNDPSKWYFPFYFSTFNFYRISKC